MKLGEKLVDKALSPGRSGTANGSAAELAQALPPAAERQGIATIETGQRSREGETRGLGDQRANAGACALTRILGLTCVMSRKPHRAMVISSSLRMMASDLATPASPSAPRP